VQAIRFFLACKPDAKSLAINRYGKPMSSRGLNKAVRRLTEACGHPAGPHALRHTGATISQKAHGDVNKTARVLGHKGDQHAAAGYDFQNGLSGRQVQVGLSLSNKR